MLLNRMNFFRETQSMFFSTQRPGRNTKGFSGFMDERFLLKRFWKIPIYCIAFWLLSPAVFAQPSNEKEWFDWSPVAKLSPVNSEIDLRFLNETVAGENGRIIARNGQFFHAGNDRAVRFWAVNGPPAELRGDALQVCAKRLARYGVNLVRVHGPIFANDGKPDLEKVKHLHEVIATMKEEGIYTHISFYFPLWFTPAADLAWLPGYNGSTHPFASLMFNGEFQKRFQEWIKTLLTSSSDQYKHGLLDEPAIFGIEIQNEDSLFFWTFDSGSIPNAQMRILEKQFGAWLTAKHGSLSQAMERWKSPSLPRDDPENECIAFAPLWSIVQSRSLRDQETVKFLYETQSGFYRQSYDYIRSLGFEGLIHASNWATASPELLGPIEKLSYTEGDFVDRHGYFECNHQGDNAAWSIRPGHTFRHRSALRFDAVEPDQPKQFVHPVIDIQYDDKPSMISETTFTRPNRYRSEAPLYFASYGALQDSDCIVHFALDGAEWSVKPNYWMQQWTLMSPSMMGQFPAAALIYRRGLVAQGQVMANVNLVKKELFELKGTPLPQDAAFDELRLKDIPKGSERLQVGQRLDPLLHFVGRSQVRFTDAKASVEAKNLAPFVNREEQTITSSTSELKLDYAKGLLLINAPQVQGASGNLQSASKINLKDMTIECNMDLAHIVAVSLDEKPLETSERILLQVMSEERTSGFDTEPASGGTLKIVNIGQNPWQVKNFQGNVYFKRSDATLLRVQRLDEEGRVIDQMGSATKISLDPTTAYYLICR